MSSNKGSVRFRIGLILIGGAMLVLALVLLRPSPDTPAPEASGDSMATVGEIENQDVHSATTRSPATQAELIPRASLHEIATESDAAQRTTELRQRVEVLSLAECRALVERLSSEEAGTGGAQLRDFAARRLAENAGPPLATNCPVDAHLSQR